MPKHVIEVLIIAALVLAIICTVSPSLTIVASEVSADVYQVDLTASTDSARDTDTATDTNSAIDEVSAQRVARHHH